jgi:hypothetical protein
LTFLWQGIESALYHAAIRAAGCAVREDFEALAREEKKENDRKA